MTPYQRQLSIAALLGVLVGIALAGVVVTHVAASRGVSVIPAALRGLDEPDPTLRGAPTHSVEGSAEIAALALQSPAAGTGAPFPDPIGGATPGVTGANVTAARPSPAVASTRPTPRVSKPASTQAPKPGPYQSIRGIASWFATGHPGVAAAGPALRAWLGKGWRGQRVTVCGAACRTVTLGDWMRADKLVDLPPDLWRAVCRLPTSRGICQVTIREGEMR